MDNLPEKYVCALIVTINPVSNTVNSFEEAISNAISLAANAAQKPMVHEDIKESIATDAMSIIIDPRSSAQAFARLSEYIKYSFASDNIFLANTLFDSSTSCPSCAGLSFPQNQPRP